MSPIVRVFLLLVFLVGCTPTSPSASVESTVAPADTVAEQLPAATDSATTATPSPDVAAPVGSTDHWVVANEKGGALWLLRADGTNVTMLEAAGAMSAAVSPDGKSLAYVVDTNEDPLTDSLELRLRSLPTGEPHTVTPLQAEVVTVVPGDVPDDLWAIAAMNELAWSPDGTALAFIAMLDGASSDIYLYHPATQAISRLSTEPTTAFEPQWSPDGTHLYFSSVESFGSGAGYGGAEGWVARADGSDVQHLPDIEYANYHLLRWLSPTQMLLSLQSQPCGYNQLQLYDLTTQESRVVWPGFFQALAYDEVSGRTFLAIPSSWGFCSDGQQTGLFVLPTLEADAERLSDEGFSDVGLHPSVAGAAFAVSDAGTLYEVAADGTLTPLPDAPAALPSASPDGGQWLWYSQFGPQRGLWAGPAADMKGVLVATDYADPRLWASENDLLYMVLPSGRLYHAAAPDFTPEVIEAIPPLERYMTLMSTDPTQQER